MTLDPSLFEVSQLQINLQSSFKSEDLNAIFASLQTCDLTSRQRSFRLRSMTGALTIGHKVGDLLWPSF